MHKILKRKIKWRYNSRFQCPEFNFLTGVGSEVEILCSEASDSTATHNAREIKSFLA